MGSATAYYLSKITDKQIILVDQYNVANDYCSSNDINRVFRYAYGKDEFYTRLAIQSRKLWQQLEQETKLQLLIPSDLLLVQGTDKEWNMFNEESHKTLRRSGSKQRTWKENSWRNDIHSSMLKEPSQIHMLESS